MSQSNPDLSLTEILWEDLRRAMQMPTNLNEQKESWNKEWARIPPPWCERLIKLPYVIAAKGSSESIFFTPGGEIVLEIWNWQLFPKKTRLASFFSLYCCYGK